MPVPDTDMACGPTVCYVMRGTDMACGPTVRYAVPGTDMAYGPTEGSGAPGRVWGDILDNIEHCK
eukprot:2732454-Rhodomonas_salina.1